jgi:hypothetical protein
MSKMKTQLCQLALRPLTKLKPKCRNKTRWCSTFDMVIRYYRFKEDDVLVKLCEDMADLEAFTLTATEERKLLALKKILDDLYLCTKKLQDPAYSFCEMRALFDCLIQEYPDLGQYISSNAAIVHSVAFESALVKLSAQQAHTLSNDEKDAVSKLKLLLPPVVVVPDDALPQLAPRNILQKAHETHLRNSYVDSTSSVCAILTYRSNIYPSVAWIPIGSVCAESLFSVADSVFDSRRLSTLPVHMEEQMFLKFNRTLWKHKYG